MKIKSLLIILPVFIAFSAFGQNLAGNWYGNLNVYGMNLPLVFHVQPVKKNKFSTTMDSPKQKAFGLTVDETKVKKDSVFFTIKSLGISTKMTFDGKKIKGDFIQYGAKMPLELSRDSSVITLAPPKRPQTPKPPFPYNVKEVKFENNIDGVTLAGTLTYPKSGNHFKAVVLISGSGAQNRDEEMLEHKPFAVLADYLTRNGIAVLRYDDRGTAQSGGNFSTATIYNFKNDATAALTYLHTFNFIDTNHIGVIGHSEGGVISEMLAAEQPKVIDFAVFMAAPAVPLDSLMLTQYRDIELSNGVADKTVAQSTNAMRAIYKMIKENPEVDSKTIIAEMQTLLPDFKKDMVNNISMANLLTTQPMKAFIQFEPKKYLEKITLPIFALNGDKDLQVRADDNTNALDKWLTKAGNNHYIIKVYPNLNHLFQPCEKCTIQEYGTIETTLSPDVLSDIANWINSLK